MIKRTAATFSVRDLRPICELVQPNFPPNQSIRCCKTAMP
jgi:hypothetical protein